MPHGWRDVRRTNIGGYVINGMSVAGHRDDTNVVLLGGQLRPGMTITMGVADRPRIGLEYRDRDGGWRPLSTGR